MVFDHIIIGGGCAGMQLAKALLSNQATSQASILIVEAAEQPPAKSWCFWAEGTPPYAEIVEKSWSKVNITSGGKPGVEAIAPMNYHYISSQRFYAFHDELFAQFPNLVRVTDAVTSVETSGELVSVSGAGTYTGRHVYDSRQNPSGGHSAGLMQHFFGLFVEADTACFQPDEATLMDFDIADSSGAGFCYILPFSATKALVEITFFTSASFNLSQYRGLTELYLKDKYPGVSFAIEREEIGHIPLFIPAKTEKTGATVDIGTRGGLTKPTTGYTFTRIFQHSAWLAHAATQPRQAADYQISKPRFLFYDSLFISILLEKPHMLKPIITRLFNAAPYPIVLSFLDEKTTLWQEARLFLNLPIGLFLKHLLLYLSAPRKIAAPAPRS